MPSTLPPLTITPPLLNSSNPWATTSSDLLALYQSPNTGAVTLRTSLLQAFSQDASHHQYTFFSASKGTASSQIVTSATGEGRGLVQAEEGSSLNTLGYSPFPLKTYLSMLSDFATSGLLTRNPIKPFIVSVTGSAEEVSTCYGLISSLLSENHPGLGLLMEINLSCPNIADKPPPAYDGSSLTEYIKAIAQVKALNTGRGGELHVGIKTPPYTYHDQFRTLVNSLETATPSCPISFITATNTLGNCLILNDKNCPALGSVNGTGIGGMAGEALHPLALGNVRTIRGLLDASEREEVRAIRIIGIGGVGNAEGWRRMRSVGASWVGVGTAFGRRGVDCFREIADGVGDGEGGFGFMSFTTSS